METPLLDSITLKRIPLLDEEAVNKNVDDTLGEAFFLFQDLRKR